MTLPARLEALWHTAAPTARDASNSQHRVHTLNARASIIWIREAHENRQRERFSIVARWRRGGMEPASMVGRGASAARGLKKLSNPLCLLMSLQGRLGGRARARTKLMMIPAMMAAMSGLGDLTKVR